MEARIEVVSAGDLAGLFSAEPIVLPASESAAVVKVRIAGDARLAGQRQITIRATALEKGLWPAVSETNVPVLIEPDRCCRRAVIVDYSTTGISRTCRTSITAAAALVRGTDLQRVTCGAASVTVPSVRCLKFWK